MTGDVTSRVVHRPTLAIKFTYWFIFILVGLYIVGPFYVPVSPEEYSNDELRNPLVTKAYGASMLLTGGAGMTALLRPAWKYRHTVLEVAMFATFLLFVFFCFLRILNYGITDLAWVSYAINALVAGVVHFKLQWEK